MAKDVNKIIDFLKKSDSILSAAKFFGGMDYLNKLAETNLELKSLIDQKLSGTVKFQDDSMTDHKFKFEITQIEFEDLGDDEPVLVCRLNIITNTNGLNDDEVELYGKWIESYFQDYRGEAYFNDDSLNKYHHYYLIVDEMNGKEMFFHANDTFEHISDKEIYDLLDEKLLKETIKDLRKLMNEIF